MFDYKFSNTQQEKNELRSKMFLFLDKLHEKYADKINENKKPVSDKKKYKHEYYIRNKHKYKKSNVS
jgi:hypothetical protein